MGKRVNTDRDAPMKSSDKGVYLSVCLENPLSLKGKFSLCFSVLRQTFTLFTCNWSIPHTKRNIRYNLYWLSWVTRSFWHIDSHTNNGRERDTQFEAHMSSISVTGRLVARALRSQSFDGRLSGLHKTMQYVHQKRTIETYDAVHQIVEHRFLHACVGPLADMWERIVGQREKTAGSLIESRNHSRFSR
jgi:hypothetical protein